MVRCGKLSTPGLETLKLRTLNEALKLANKSFSSPQVHVDTDSVLLILADSVPIRSY